MTAKRNDSCSRAGEFARAADAGDERIPVVISTADVVDVADGPEILVHEPDAVDLRRAPLPIIATHKSNTLNVGIVEDLQISGGQMRGMARFGNRAEAAEYKADVLAGIIRSVSAGYRRIKGTIRKDGVLVTTRWMPTHVAMIAEPADVGAGFFRDDSNGIGPFIVQEEQTMTTENPGNQPEQSGGGGEINVVAFREARAAARKDGESTGAARERERIAEIDAVFSAFATKGEDVAALKDQCIRGGSTVEQSRAALLSYLAGTPDATPTASRKLPDDEGQCATVRGTRLEAGATDREKFAEGATRALLLRSDVIRGEEAVKERAGNHLAALSLSDLAREWCSINGISIRGKSTNDVVRYVLSDGRRDAVGLGTVDFTGILANVASKSLLAGWEENMTTWRQWCRVGSVPDFKRANRTGLSGADLLDKVPENMEYKRGDLSDRTEYMTAYKYGKLFAFTREAIINDDLQALSAMPRKLGRAADLTVNKTVVDLLCTASGVGPTLNQDATALFHSNHNNYTATSGAPSVANLEVGRNAMARQTDPNNGMPLNIQPKYLFVPSALVTTSKVLVASEKDPLGTASATGGATTPNPFYNSLTVIGEPYLDDTTHANGTVAWYLFADQNMHDTFEVAFVNGQSTPYLESRDGWSVDGVEYKVRIEFGVSALDYRAMYRKKGA